MGWIYLGDYRNKAGAYIGGKFLSIYEKKAYKNPAIIVLLSTEFVQEESVEGMKYVDQYFNPETYELGLVFLDEPHRNSHKTTISNQGGNIRMTLPQQTRTYNIATGRYYEYRKEDMGGNYMFIFPLQKKDE
jgi:hypothetical protein